MNSSDLSKRSEGERYEECRVGEHEMINGRDSLPCHQQGLRLGTGYFRLSVP
jgi:hypothetical protein